MVRTNHHLATCPSAKTHQSAPITDHLDVHRKAHCPVKVTQIKNLSLRVKNAGKKILEHEPATFCTTLLKCSRPIYKAEKGLVPGRSVFMSGRRGWVEHFRCCHSFCPQILIYFIFEQFSRMSHPF